MSTTNELTQAVSTVHVHVHGIGVCKQWNGLLD